jgi:hypothetical protein
LNTVLQVISLPAEITQEAPVVKIVYTSTDMVELYKSTKKYTYRQEKLMRKTVHTMLLAVAEVTDSKTAEVFMICRIFRHSGVKAPDELVTTLKKSDGKCGDDHPCFKEKWGFTHELLSARQEVPLAYKMHDRSTLDEPVAVKGNQGPMYATPEQVARMLTQRKCLIASISTHKIRVI